MDQKNGAMYKSDPKPTCSGWLYRSAHRVDNPSKPWPIILWLQGGPGSSGVGNFKEIGPLDDNLKPRNFTWLKKADLLFVDNPVGTGYSFVEDSRLLVKTDKEAATDLTTLLTELFNGDYSLQKSPFFIVAESYGGKFAVTLGLSVIKAIHKGKLKLKLGVLSTNLIVKKMVHALELPSHWRVQWFDVKWNVEQYKKEKHMDPIFLELAKLNFNMIQAKLQIEVKELSRWWENLGIKKELSFARIRLVESFMCAVGVAFEPKYKSIKKWLTKVIIFVIILDDVYDIHASFEELKPFTMAFERLKEKGVMLFRQSYAI
ncbi:hypothetical protein AAZX31_12G169000 [Glycine max]